MKTGAGLRKIFLVVAALCALAVAFAAGFVVCLKLRHTPSAEATAQRMRPAGDAPPAVRAGVAATLEALEQAYQPSTTGQLDSRQIDALMTRAFAPDADILLLGTEGVPAEWVRGETRVRDFLGHDCAQWGQVRFDPQSALVWSSGNVAWVATAGTVEFRSGSRPLRLTAVLEQRGGRWVFRQIQFQWNDEPAEASDLFRLETYRTALRHALRHLAR